MVKDGTVYGQVMQASLFTYIIVCVQKKQRYQGWIYFDSG